MDLVLLVTMIFIVFIKITQMKIKRIFFSFKFHIIQIILNQKTFFRIYRVLELEMPILVYNAEGIKPKNGAKGLRY